MIHCPACSLFWRKASMDIPPHLCSRLGGLVVWLFVSFFWMIVSEGHVSWPLLLDLTWSLFMPACFISLSWPEPAALIWARGVNSTISCCQVLVCCRFWVSFVFGYSILASNFSFEASSLFYACLARVRASFLACSGCLLFGVCRFVLIGGLQPALTALLYVSQQ